MWNPIDKIKPPEDGVEYYVTIKQKAKRRSRGEYQTNIYVTQSLYKNEIWYIKEYYEYEDDCDGHYGDKHQEWENKNISTKVLAWMEIPEYPGPYIEGGE